MENIYVQFDGMVYQQIVGIPMGTNFAPPIADLFLYCYERDFTSDLQKSKRFDLIDMFNDTSRYLDDIFTIDNPEFEKHISDIYLAELQLNKANTSDKESSFIDLNIKVIGSDIHTSVYDKRDDFGFPIVYFPWLSGDVPRLPFYGIYILQLVRFARCCTSVLDFHSKNLRITSKLLTQGYRYHKICKTFGKFFRSYSELLSKFGYISFKEYLSKGISHPVVKALGLVGIMLFDWCYQSFSGHCLYRKCIRQVALRFWCFWVNLRFFFDHLPNFFLEDVRKPTY